MQNSEAGNIANNTINNAYYTYFVDYFNISTSHMWDPSCDSILYGITADVFEKSIAFPPASKFDTGCRSLQVLTFDNYCYYSIS